MQLNNKQSLTIVRPLLFTMGLILSGHSLAAKTVYATDTDLDTEISNRVDGDVAEATARAAADNELQTSIDTNKTNIENNERTLNQMDEGYALEASARIEGDKIEAELRDVAIEKAVAVEVTARDAAIGAAIATDATARDAAIGTAVADVLPVLPAPNTGNFRLSYNSTTEILFWESLPPYQIGNTGPAGGIVFHVSNGGFSGLEAAPAGWHGGGDPSVNWGCGGKTTGATKTEIGTGAENTADILAVCSQSNIAAKIADDYELNGYTDWFLPSKYELNALYLQKDVVGGFATDEYYWSSSEGVYTRAWGQIFTNGDPGGGP